MGFSWLHLWFLWCPPSMHTKTWGLNMSTIPFNTSINLFCPHLALQHTLNIALHSNELSSSCRPSLYTMDQRLMLERDKSFPFPKAILRGHFFFGRVWDLSHLYLLNVVRDIRFVIFAMSVLFVHYFRLMVAYPSAPQYPTVAGVSSTELPFII